MISRISSLFTQKAGFISEILTLAALQGGKNVLQDGSLRDSEWYKTYFHRLRKEFPDVRQSIIHVTAPPDAVFQRAKVSSNASFVHDTAFAEQGGILMLPVPFLMFLFKFDRKEQLQPDESYLESFWKKP